MNEQKWRFVSNQHSALVGINDAGIETFSASVLHSLVREMIQNSLDAKKPDVSVPVRVEFSLSSIPFNDFPDYSGFSDVISKCISSNENEPQAVKFFSKASEVLKEEIPILRISDHNTTGLRGSNTCAKGTVWSRLVKESGSSNKEDGSGGSFGIGKSAAFACSNFRTVFYSSLDCDGLRSSIGVARLISFEQTPGDWTTGIGYYSENNLFIAIPKEMQLEYGYQRTPSDSGTDVYVMGACVDENYKKDMINAVLINFIVSIVKRKLVVVIDGSVIDEETIGEYISQINPYDSNKALASLVPYYHLLTSADPSIKRIRLDATQYGAKYGFQDGDCTLYLMEGDNLNRKILMTRSAGMSLFEQDRFSSDIEFTGILMIEGASMNKAYKEMEVPSHDAWKPSRCKENTAYFEAMFKDLRKYLREQVNESFGKVTTTEIDAYAAGEFLPDSTGTTEQEEPRKGGLFERIRKLTGRERTPVKKKPRPVTVTPKPVNTDEPTKDPKKEPPVTPKQPPKPNAPTFKPLPVKSRTICTDPKQGAYLVKFIVPKKAKSGRLDFSISGEQSDFDVKVLGASVRSSEGTSIASIDGNSLYLGNLKAGDNLTLAVNIDFDAYCMLEVQYYESKR